jgi:hypothetical protein
VQSDFPAYRFPTRADLLAEDSGSQLLPQEAMLTAARAGHYTTFSKAAEWEALLKIGY